MFTIVQLVGIDDTGDTRYRMHWPAKTLAEQRPKWQVLNVDVTYKNLANVALGADLLVVYQSHDDTLLSIIDQRRKNNLKTLVEYNDNFYAPPPCSPAAQHWSSPIVWGMYEKFMELADGLIVTGPGLKELFSPRFAEKITILKNHLPAPPEHVETLLDEKGTDISIGWAGSVGHMSDILWIAPTLMQLRAEFPHIRLRFMGNESLERELALPPGTAEFHNWGSMESYYSFLKGLHIGIVPVLDTPYNRCRSDIKAVELASRAVCPVVSELLPYEEFRDATGCPSFQSADELGALLRTLIAGSSKDYARTAHEYVARERLFANNTTRAEYYERFLPAKPQNALQDILPAKTGFHEIQLPRLAKNESVQTLEQAQALLKLQKRTEASTLLLNYVERNPLAADVVLSSTQLLMAHDKDRALHTLRKYRTIFTRDLRFTFRLMQMTNDLSEWNTLWSETVNQLESESQTFRHFYYPLMIKQLQIKGISLSDEALLEKLLTLFPMSAFLKFSLMQLLQKKGDHVGACALATEVEQAIVGFGLDKTFFDQSSLAYISTWQRALVARTTR